MNVCQPLVQSIALFDVRTMGRLVLHAEHSRAVFVPETLPLPDRSRPRELGCGPRGDITQSNSADKIMMCDNMTAALPPHVENAALKHSILSQRAVVFPDV